MEFVRELTLRSSTVTRCVSAPFYAQLGEPKRKTQKFHLHPISRVGFSAMCFSQHRVAPDGFWLSLP